MIEFNIIAEYLPPIYDGMHRFYFDFKGFNFRKKVSLYHQLPLSTVQVNVILDYPIDRSWFAFAILDAIRIVQMDGNIDYLNKSLEEIIKENNIHEQLSSSMKKYYNPDYCSENEDD